MSEDKACFPGSEMLICASMGRVVAGQGVRPWRLRSGPAVNPCFAVRIAVCAREPDQFISFWGRHAIQRGQVHALRQMPVEEQLVQPGVGADDAGEEPLIRV